MNAADPSAYTAETLANPTIDPATLAVVAGARPDLWATILAHPNCYPALAAWIHQQQNTHAVPQPAFTEASPYMQYPGAGQTVQRSREAKVRPSQLILALTAFLAAVSLFLPIATVSVYGFSMGFSYFSDEMTTDGKTEGAILLVLFLVTLGFAVTAILARAKWARITASIIALLGGLFGMIDGFINATGPASTPGASIGGGTVLLIISSIAMITFAIVALVPAKRA